jgi:RNA polymerase sigma-70 factor (ECF subfamily)
VQVRSGKVRGPWEAPVESLREQARFEQIILPHLDAAYNLARWLTRNPHDAEDVVQEALCRALRFFHGFRGGDARTWLLKVVRNTCYTWLEQHRGRQPAAPFNEQEHDSASDLLNPEKMFLRRADRQMLLDAMEALPVHYREALILRELEGLSYQEIATITGVPLGTVMSRLARGRRHLQHRLALCLGGEG